MKYLVVSFILFFCTLQTFGQQEYFVYLQTDNSQAFYVRIHNNVYSSTASGYLLLSKLPDSTAAITIGFAKNVYPEQQFTIPANHKDAGYLLKNFGARGWGLFNLQSLAVIMTSTPPEEKKSLELTGSKKNDAFSLLLANAVNDTAVLYTVNKPPKIIAAPVVVAEKKPDTVSIVREVIPATDSNAVVKNNPEKKDSTAIVKTIAVPDKENNASGKATATSDSLAAASKKTAAADSIAVVKNNSMPVIITGTPKNVADKNNASAAAKNASSTRKDTIIIGGTTALKPKPERRDTIIIMKGRVMEDKKVVAKNTTVKKADSLAADKPTDSLQLVKSNPENKPSEKIIVTANEGPPVIVPRVATKKDSVLTNTAIKKDTASALVKAEIVTPAEEKKEALAEVPAKRMRPFVNKVTELYTDTSYVAIFLDESKDKFDTIRISIPFAEAEAAAKASQRKPTVAVTNPPTVVKKDSTAVVATESVKTTTAPPLSLNSDCKEIAFDSDIDKLRIKMLLVTTDEDRIAVAKKVFRQKCFSVKQVRALSELFKSDEGKYKWFDAVYPFASDSANFSSLAELLKNEYYLLRFKAMLRR